MDLMHISNLFYSIAVTRWLVWIRRTVTMARWTQTERTMEWLDLSNPTKCPWPFQYYPYGVIAGEPGILIPSVLPSFTPHLYSAKIKGWEQTWTRCPAPVPKLFGHHLVLLAGCIYFVYSCIAGTEEQEDSQIQIHETSFRIPRNSLELLHASCGRRSLRSSFVCQQQSACGQYWQSLLTNGIHMVFMSTLSADLSAPEAEQMDRLTRRSALRSNIWEFSSNHPVSDEHDSCPGSDVIAGIQRKSVVGPSNHI